MGPATISALSRRYRIPLPALAGASLALVVGALVLVFFVAPNDANQGFSQRIFYFHVSIAFTAYACFAAGAWKAFVHLWKRDPEADLESYVAIHQGVIFGLLVLVTGSIWAKISWGHWWLWSENQLVLFLGFTQRHLRECIDLALEPLQLQRDDHDVEQQDREDRAVRRGDVPLRGGHAYAPRRARSLASSRLPESSMR